MVGTRTMEVLILLVCLDVFLAWIQTDPGRWPRRLIHLLTGPLRSVSRALLARVPTGGWDFSPVLLVALLTLLRVWWKP